LLFFFCLLGPDNVRLPALAATVPDFPPSINPVSLRDSTAAFRQNDRLAGHSARY
jgi:hypothetical protein